MRKAIKCFRGDNWYLSNFGPGGLEYGKLFFDNGEAGFQAQKPEDPEVRAEFQGLNPSEAKKKGRHVKLRPDWEEVKDQIMYEIVLAKFTQNPDLKEKLLATGDAELIEGNNWNDDYWGVVNGVGQNKLGKILMRVRSELRDQEFLTVETVRTTNAHGKELERKIVHMKPAVAGLVTKARSDCEEPLYLLVSQKRLATSGYLEDCITWEIPAGMMDVEGEAPIDCLEREILEETGYDCSKESCPHRGLFIKSFYPLVGCCDHKVSIYLMEFGSYVERVNNELDEDVMESKWFTEKEVKKMINEGLIVDGKTIMAFWKYIALTDCSLYDY